MISVKAFLGGLLLLTSAYANASEFLCPVPANLQKLSCEGAVKVKNLTELIGYKENLAQKKGKAKDIIIDFDVHSTSLTISTPCKITLAERRSISINGDLCLHADNGTNFEEETNLRAHNVRLESNKKVVIENHADIKADNLELLSLGKTDDSRAHIREGAKVDVNNLSLEAYERVSLGANSTYNVLEDLKLYSRGDDDASINTNTKIIASTFELQAYEKARIANNVSIKADIAIINGKSCSISNKTTAITASEKMGSCFTQSSPKGLFSVDVTSGFAPLKVTFNASKIKSTNYVWSFGNGDTLATL
ncbi:MAG: PKD domain-containing protein [Bacteriovorax sp.]